MAILAIYAGLAAQYFIELEDTGILEIMNAIFNNLNHYYLLPSIELALNDLI